MYPVIEPGTNDAPPAPNSVVVAQVTQETREVVVVKSEVKPITDLPQVPVYGSPHRNSAITENPLLGAASEMSVWDLPRRTKLKKLLWVAVYMALAYHTLGFIMNVCTTEHIFHAINKALKNEGMDEIPFPHLPDLFRMKIHEPFIGIFVSLLMPLIGYKALKNGGSTRWLACLNCCTCCAFVSNLVNFTIVGLLLIYLPVWTDLAPECDAQEYCKTMDNDTDQKIMECIDGTSALFTLSPRCEPLQPLFVHCEHDHDHHGHHHHGHHHHMHKLHHSLKMIRAFRLITSPHYPHDHDFMPQHHPYGNDDITIEPPMLLQGHPGPAADEGVDNFNMEVEIDYMSPPPVENDASIRVVNIEPPHAKMPNFQQLDIQERPHPLFMLSDEAPVEEAEASPYRQLREIEDFPPPPSPMMMEPPPFEDGEMVMIRPPLPPHHAHKFLERFRPPGPPRRPHLPPSRDPTCKLNHKAMRYFHVYIIAQPELYYYVLLLLLFAGTSYFYWTIFNWAIFHQSRSYRKELIESERQAREIQDFHDESSDDEGILDPAAVVIASTGDGFDKEMHPMEREGHQAREVPLLQGQKTEVV